MAEFIKETINNISEYPNSFKRQGAFPLELYSVFYNFEQAQNYAKNNGVAYIGQQIYVVNREYEEDGVTIKSTSVTPYIITDENGHLEESSNYCRNGSGHRAIVANYYDLNTAEGAGCFAGGYKTTAKSHYAFAIGSNTIANGPAAYAEGAMSQSLAYASHAEGTRTVASGSHSHAEGSGTKAGAIASHAEGVETETVAGADGCHAEGRRTVASAPAAHAEGWGTRATGNYSHSEGCDVKAIGHRTHAEGDVEPKAVSYMLFEAKGEEYTGEEPNFHGKLVTHLSHILTNANKDRLHLAEYSAYGYTSHREGRNTLAFGSVSHAEGEGTMAFGGFSHAEGYLTATQGENAHSEGYATLANGNAAHTEGHNTIAADGAHAEGSDVIKINLIPREGYDNLNRVDFEYEEAFSYTVPVTGDDIPENTVTTITIKGPQALDIGAHAEGIQTLAYARGAHTEGYRTVAYGNYSHANGIGTVASAEGQTVIGKYNALDNSAMFVVGVGSEDASRANAFTVGKDDNENYIKIGSTKLTEAQLIHMINLINSIGVTM